MIWGSGYELEQISYKFLYFTPYYHPPLVWYDLRERGCVETIAET